MSAEAKQADYVGLAADIVSAYVTKNSVTRAELPALIQSVQRAALDAWITSPCTLVGLNPDPQEVNLWRNRLAGEFLVDLLSVRVEGAEWLVPLARKGISPLSAGGFCSPTSKNTLSGRST